MLEKYMKKLRIIGLPFLICFVLFNVVYTFYNWLFFIKLQWFSIDSMITNFLIPVLGSFLIVYFYLKNAINQFKFKNDNTTFLFGLVMLGIAVPGIITQDYMEDATGTLTELHSIKEIDTLSATKFYRLKDYYLYKKAVGTKFETKVSGKNSQNFDMTLYVVQPILQREADTVYNATHHWFCTRYFKTISNFKSDSEKRGAIEVFVKKSQEEFEASTPKFSYLERDTRSFTLKQFGQAGSHSKVNRNGADIFLFPREGAFKDRTGSSMMWILITLGLSLTILLIYIYFLPLKNATQLKAMKLKMTKEASRTWQERYEWIAPRTGFETTPYLIFALVGVYLAMMLTGCGFMEMEGKALYDWGALYRPEVVQGAWWRLFSSLLLHASIFHLVNNLFCLYFAGIVLEAILGSSRMFLVYILCGLVASISSLLWNDSIMSLGASGAIFGLFGFLLALKLFRSSKLKIEFQFFFISPLFIGINLFMGFISPIVDNAAHVGGLVFGLVLGALFYPSLEQQD